MTKYSIPDDHEWQTDQQQTRDSTSPVTTVKKHEIDIIHTHDPSKDMGYGRDKYTIHVTYNDDTEPSVLYVVKHRWKGNFWRDTTDLDWRDTPDVVRNKAASLLPVEDAESLDCGVRMMDEGGEDRWEKLHKPQMGKMNGPSEMWGVSYLKDAVRPLKQAADALDDEDGSELVDELLARLKGVIESVDGRVTDGEGEL